MPTQHTRRRYGAGPGQCPDHDKARGDKPARRERPEHGTLKGGRRPERRI